MFSMDIFVYLGLTFGFVLYTIREFKVRSYIFLDLGRFELNYNIPLKHGLNKSGLSFGFGTEFL